MASPLFCTFHVNKDAAGSLAVKRTEPLGSIHLPAVPLMRGVNTPAEIDNGTLKSFSLGIFMNTTVEGMI